MLTKAMTQVKAAKRNTRATAIIRLWEYIGISIGIILCLVTLDIQRVNSDWLS